jgi:hypothetical protein
MKILNKERIYLSAGIAIALGMILLGNSNTMMQSFAQMNGTATNTTNTTNPVSATSGSNQPFVFVYSVSGGFPGFEQIRALYNSMTKELVFLNHHPFTGLTGDVNNVIKIIPLNDTVENNLKKVIRDNNIFATKGTYYTRGFDLPADQLSILLDGKTHSVAWNVPAKPGVPVEPVPDGLFNVIGTIQNITKSK